MKIPCCQWSNPMCITANGIRLKMDLQSFQIVDPGEDYLQDSYLIHGVADAFLEKYPHISYQNVGLNYLWVFCATILNNG